MSYQEINITSYDHDSLKQDLIAYLKGLGTLGDFNYEGSYINTIIDLVIRNAQYDAFLANMLSNESFIDSAQIRGNVVSHATKLSYVPRSMTAQRAVVDITVIPSDKTNLATNITIPINTIFVTSYQGKSYQFVTIDSYLMSLDSNNNYVVTGVELVQGQLITNSFIHGYGNSEEIPNSNIDTSTLSVSSVETGSPHTFELVNTISDLSISQKDFYFLFENYRQNYELEFGKDLISREPIDGCTITISYINVDSEAANGAQTFIAAQAIGNYSNITVTTTQNAYGGSDREDIENVRFLAPKAYAAQDRAVRPVDYSLLIKKKFPFVKSLKVWGGEKNDPPQYGKVFMSIIFSSGEILTRSIKTQIITYLDDYEVGSITPEITDSEEINLDLTISFAYNSKLTSNTFNQLSTLIGTIVDTYNTGSLNDFDDYYNDSYLNDQIMGITGIESSNITKTAKRQMTKLDYVNPTYTYNFKNPVDVGSFYVDTFTIDITADSEKIYDDSNGNIIYEKTIGSNVTKTTIGTIDYTTGNISFVATMVQSDSYFYIYVTPSNDNFYVYNNKYLNISQKTYSQLTLFPQS